MIINRKFCQALNTLLQREQPDVILCLHPFSAMAMHMWKNSVDGRKPAITGLLTDYTVHPFWWQLDLDGYFVGSPDLVRDMAKHGIDRKRIWPVGIPVDHNTGSYKDKAVIRRKLGLDQDRPTVLIMGGGLGLGGLDEIVRCLGNMEQDIQVLVVTGANSAVQESLMRLVAGMATPVKVFGFVNNVPELMAASDLIITKPGGVTVAEALATGLPIIIWKPIPGQEVRNTSFLMKKDLAVQVEDLQELVPMVRLALQGRPEARLELSLANKSAARNIADITIKTFIN
jgi:processive 1,2-diacylglycerol beta-glucosyltransferase